ncbi:MAG: ComEC/Rec2 family competence protein [Patescibacteria group bacterium]|nr:ComEC/Rec2 family competence protein [Patescibacteria group bacterium]
MFKKYFWPISAVSFLLGLFLVHYFAVTKLLSSFFYFVLFLIFFFITIKFKKNIFLILFFIFLAIWRYLLIFPENNLGRIENYYGQDFSLIGKVISEPELKDNKQKIKLKIISGQDDLGNSFKLEGKILLTTQAYPLYVSGDLLELSGDWLEPGVIEDFDYGLYLRRYGITAVSYYPSIRKIKSGQEPLGIKKVFFIINNFRKRIAQQFDFSLSLDSASILKAMLLGDKSSLNSDLIEKFSRSGLSHIIAISGLHISLLSSLFLNFLLFVGLSRKKAFYFSILFLIFYLILIGAPASACRASLMGFLSFLAIYMGRVGNLSNVLFFAGISLLLFNPLLVFGDLGFQLSFLAVLGIIYLYPIIKEILSLKIFKKIRINEAVLDILSITISVQLIAGPILISSFKQFSLIAPLSNLLVVWLLPLIISLSIIAIFLSFVFSFLGQLIYLLVDVIIKYIILINNIVNKIPGSFININSWSIYLSIIYYLLLIYLIKNWRK